MIGNQSSQVAQPNDNYIEFYVEQNKKTKKKRKGGEKNMSNDNLDKGVVPAVDPKNTTEPDGKGTMATAKADFPANAKEKATRRYAKKSLRKAARFIEKATQTLEATPALSKADLPKIGRAGSVTVQNATFDSDAGANPNPTNKALPDVGRADTPAKVDNATNPYGVQLTSVRKAIKALQKAEKKLVGVGRYAQVANSTVDRPAAVTTKAVDGDVEKDVTDTVENTVGAVLKADGDTCCDNACGKCKGPGCGCCADCKSVAKAADTDADGDTSADTDDDKDAKPSIKKSVWGGSFLPVE